MFKKLSRLVTLKPFVLKMTFCGHLRVFENVFAKSPQDGGDKFIG